MKFFRVVWQLLVVLILTALTQIGGLVWLLCYWLAGYWKKGRRLLKAITIFVPVYLICVTGVLPLMAPYWGRAPLPVFASADIKPVSLWYPLFNRHYVSLPTKRLLLEAAEQMRRSYPDVELQYLDAGFPLINGFPLLPHLSHSDGRKVDLAFFYLKSDGKPTNEKPSRSGYGVFEEPTAKERATATECRDQGYWQYSYPQYLTMGSRPNLLFDKERTKQLLKVLLGQPDTEKVFLEPHLQKRLGLEGNAKLRFHGCQAVRHDDHIHLQLE